MTNFENKFLYRLVKALYVIVFVISIPVFLMIGWWSHPIKELDNYKSTITCDDGKSYSLSTLNIYATLSEKTQLDKQDDEKVRTFCKENKTYIILNKKTNQQLTIKYSDFDKYNVIEPNLNSISYKFNPVERTNGGWLNVLLWWVLGIGGSYIVLNLARETLNYIFLGKPFDWMWLIIPIGFLASLNEEQTK